jgi:hypothetical protein
LYDSDGAETLPLTPLPLVPAVPLAMGIAEGAIFGGVDFVLEVRERIEDTREE